MNYYKRTITKREVINNYGKLGYIAYDQFVKTNDIAPFNKGKRVAFEPIKKPRELIHAKANTIVEVRHDISNSEAHFRKKIANYRW